MTEQEQTASFILHPEEWDIRISPISLGMSEDDSQEVGYCVFAARLKHVSQECYVGETCNSLNGVSIT